MRRRFFIVMSIVGIYWIGSLATALAEDTVSRIQIDSSSITMGGCEDKDSIVLFDFTSVGSGDVTITAEAVDGTVGTARVNVTAPQTSVRLPISNGFVGEARIRVEAEGYQVADGAPGKQNAADETLATIGMANCAMQMDEPAALSEPSSPPTNDTLRNIAIVTIGVLGVALVIWLVRNLRV